MSASNDLFMLLMLSTLLWLSLREEDMIRQKLQDQLERTHNESEIIGNATWNSEETSVSNYDNVVNQKY